MSNQAPVKLTKYETAVIRAILDSEYGDEPTDPVWYEYVAEDSRVPTSAISGVISSLSKKGLAWTDDPMSADEMPSIGLTDKGVQAARDNNVGGFKLEEG